MEILSSGLHGPPGPPGRSKRGRPGSRGPKGWPGLYWSDQNKTIISLLS